MTTLIDPTSAAPAGTREAPPAAALSSLAGRRLALLKNAWPSWHAMTDRLEARLTGDVTGLATRQYLIPNGSAAPPEQLKEIAASADAAVVGLANCGSCTAWSFHDAATLAAAGLPVVLVVTGEFTGLVAALARTQRVSLPVVVVPANPETVSEDTALALLEDAYEPIVQALLSPQAAPPGHAEQAAAPLPLDFADEDAALEALHDRGWTDGLPVVLPTARRVEAMLAALGAGPGDVVAAMPPSGYPVTGRALAANAVMAGCAPRHLPVLEALVRAVCVPDYNLNGIATTTGPSTPFAVVSGPAAAAAGLNSGRGALGPGWRANASIGRALRLLIANVGGARPGEVSKSIHGQPGRYTMCIAESADSPWEPLHVTLGLAAADSAVTALGATGSMNVLTPRSDTGAMLTLLADALAYLGNPNMVMGKGTVGVLVTPGHARAMARAGLSKADVAAQIWERSWIPVEKFPESARAEPPYQFVEHDGRIYPVAGPQHVYVVVVGGPEPTHATVVPAHPSCNPVTQRIGLAR